MKFNPKLRGLTVLVASGVFGLFGLAQAQAQAQIAAPAGTATQAAPAAPGAVQPNADARADGEVRKVEKENSKITLKHGELKNLDMPGMTMVFRVRDPALLDTVKAGDKVSFKAEKRNGAFFVTEIQPAR